MIKPEFSVKSIHKAVPRVEGLVCIPLINPFLHYISLDLREPSDTFPIPDIIYDPLLILSLYAFLFADQAFKAPNLTSPIESDL
jgi:hypothetical protein